MPSRKAIRRWPLAIRKHSNIFTNAQRLKPGFTLIELLVVVAILGILAGIITISLVGHQKQARDAQRKSDLQQVARAMQAAKNDCNGAAYYPFPVMDPDLLDHVSAYDHIVTELKLDGYLKSYINDPKSKNPLVSPFAYEYVGDYNSLSVGGYTGLDAGTYCPSLARTNFLDLVIEKYFLRVKLENGKDPDIVKSFNSCPELQNPANSDNGFAYLWPIDTPTITDGYYYVCSE